MKNWSSKVNQPFKPLNIKRPGDATSEHSVKGRRLAAPEATRRPTIIVRDTNESPLKELNSQPSSRPASNESRKIYSVLYRKRTTKKNKTWDGDGTVESHQGYLILKNLQRKILGRCSHKDDLTEGELVVIGNLEVEIQSLLEQKEDIPQDFSKPHNELSATRSSLPSNDPSISDLLSRKNQNNTSTGTGAPSDHVAPASAEQFYGANYGRAQPINTKPKYDPHAPGAVVMSRPPSHQIGDGIIDVVIDPLISKRLRPHQIEGVKFLYESVMGYRDFGGQGALLADDMGLGKTLTTIALIWTLLRQSPIAKQPPVAKRVLIVCPVTLIANWRAEFNKWLGADRVGVYSVESNTTFKGFLSSNVYQVMIIGYEKVRALSNELQAASFDLVVCDEGHRLKTATNKSLQVLQSLDISRRVILSGTPIQNDLMEFRTMADFLNPGILGKESSFKKNYEIPIMRSRQPGALAVDIEKGNESSEELYQITKQFVLRRSASELASFLPPKTETVLFCRPSATQQEVYSGLLQSKEVTTALGSSDSMVHLRAIILLKKVCNSPLLLSGTDYISKDIDALGTITSSGKAKVLKAFLNILFNTTDEKVVIVSGYTQTLDFIEKIIRMVKGSPAFVRLDGSTPQKQRQKLVDNFNRSSSEEVFAFLLSAKSGGTGLNLIGASRLFLFDTDWNPSVDQQSMARIHRDGQKRPVYIYRLLLTGCIDEKIYQRQATKLGLADKFMEGQDSESSSSTANKGKGSSDTFTYSELRDLFSINTATRCNTHDLLECSCASSKEDAGSQLASQIVPEVDKPGHTEPLKNNDELVISDDEDIDANADEGENMTDEDSDHDGDNGLGGWITASDIALGKVKHESQTERETKQKLRGLFDYSHILPSNYEQCGSDSILRQVLDKNTVSFIFSKSGAIFNQPNIK